MRDAGRAGGIGFKARFLYFLSAYLAFPVCSFLDSCKSFKDGVVSRFQVGEDCRAVLAAHHRIGLVDDVRFRARLRGCKLPIIWHRRILASDASHLRLQFFLLRQKLLFEMFGFHKFIHRAQMITEYQPCARDVASRCTISENAALLRAMISVLWFQ